MKRKLKTSDDVHKQKKLNNSEPKKRKICDFEAFGPSKPLPVGKGPIAFDAQLPGLPTRPDASLLYEKMQNEQRVEFMFSRWTIAQERFQSRFHEKHYLFLMGTHEMHQTVVAVVDNVYPYFYAELPFGMGPQHADAFRRDCEYDMRRFVQGLAKARKDDNEAAKERKSLLRQELDDILPPSTNDSFYIIDVEYVERLPVKGYTTEMMRLFKITCRNDKTRRKLARKLQKQGIRPTCLMTQSDKAKIDYKVQHLLDADREELAMLARQGSSALRDESGNYRKAKTRSEIYRAEFAKAIKNIPVQTFRSFEADLNFGVQLNTDLKLKVNQWVSIDSPHTIPYSFENTERWTDFQIEIHADVSEIRIEEKEKIGPIYQFSFDGEMRAMQSGFPSANESPIIQMGISVRTDITGPAHDYTGILCQGPVGAMQDETKAVSSFTYEAGLLICFVHAISIHGTYGEIWTGWNINEFDSPYVYDRLKETFATEFERCYMILKRRQKSDGYIRKLIALSKNSGYETLPDLFAEMDINWILNRLYPFPKRRPGDSASDLKARLTRNNQSRRDNFTTIQELVTSVRRSRRARATLAEIGVIPPLSNLSGDGDSERFYWDLLCQLFPEWQNGRESGLSAWSMLMGYMSPFRKGMATFRCQNANNAVRDAFNFYEPSGETDPEWNVEACGQDSVYEANRLYQVYRSFESRAHGFTESNPTIVQGCMSFDGYQVWRKEVKRRGYGLKTVYEDVMKTKTAEIDYELIPPYHQAALNTRYPERFPDATIDGNTILTNYCGADARAPLEIDSKKEFGLTYVELGRVTGVDIGDLADRGASIRSTMLIKAEAGEMKMVFPSKPPVEDEGSYQGAYVYEPVSNFYRQPVATLDFSSLYPSIIIAFNLCYSTIIELTERELCCDMCTSNNPKDCHYRADHETDRETIQEAATRLGLGPEDYWSLPVAGLYTVKEHIRKGILPRVCAALLDKRKIAKKYLKNAKATKVKTQKAIDDLLKPLQESLSHRFSTTELELLDLLFTKRAPFSLENTLQKALENNISFDDSTIEQLTELDRLNQVLATALRLIPIYNGRQLSYKLCGNSVYGYTGSKTSLVPDQRIALVVTTIGMNLILDSASVTVDHMKKGWRAPKTRDLRERFAWLESYFAVCREQGIAPLATKTADQENAIRTCIRKGKPARDVEPFGPDDDRPVWQEPPDPFSMPGNYQNNFQAQMTTQRHRTRVLFKHAYDSKLSPEELGLTEAQVKKQKRQKTKLSKTASYAYNCKMPSSFTSLATQSGSTTQPVPMNVSSSNSLDAKHPPLFRSIAGRSLNLSAEDFAQINQRHEAWSELCCWNQNERLERDLSQEDLYRCIDTDNAEDVQAAKAFLEKFRTPGNYKCFWPSDCESFEPPYVYQDDPTIVYGDTDSIMVKLGDLKLPSAHTIGLKLELVLNIFFAPLITLVQEYEKVYEFYDLREQKKRYTGSLFKPFSLVMDCIDAKGSEAARRDNCKLMVKILKKIQQMIFLDKVDNKSVYNYIRSEFKKIYNGDYDMSQFIITQKFSKAEDEYDNTPAHIRLVQIMRERDPASAPQVGSRIPYIFVAAAKGAKTSDRVEDPLYALKHQIALDYEHYVLEKFQPAIRGALGRCMPTNMLNSLFSKDLIKKKIKRSGQQVASFFNLGLSEPEIVIHNRCMVCKARPTKKHGSIEFAVCGSQRCVDQIASQQQKVSQDVFQMQEMADEIWDICRRCVEDNAPGLDVERCANHDCQYWFVRTERQNAADKAKKDLQRIDACQTYQDLF